MREPLENIRDMAERLRPGEYVQIADGFRELHLALVRSVLARRGLALEPQEHGFLVVPVVR